MTPQLVFNIFKNLGKFIPATGYYKLAINGMFWEARDLQSDGGIAFYDYHGNYNHFDEVWTAMSK
jgi:hypothetical protein